MDFLETITCRRCDQVFFICKSCYRGQAYCRQLCRQEARAEQVQLANQTYLATLNGQERRAAAVEAFRARQRRGLASSGTLPSSGAARTSMSSPECNRSRCSAPRFPVASWPLTARCCLCGRLGRVIAVVDRS